MNCIRPLVIAAVGVGVLLASTARSQELPPRLRRLQDLPPVQVSVVSPEPGNDAEIWDATALQTALELKLRQTGIRVLPAEDSTTFPTADLNLDILAIWSGSRKDQRIVAFELTLKRYVRIRPAVGAFADLWTSGLHLATIGTDLNFPDRFQVRVLAVLDGLLNDYLAANASR